MTYGRLVVVCLLLASFAGACGRKDSPVSSDKPDTVEGAAPPPAAAAPMGGVVGGVVGGVGGRVMASRAASSQPVAVPQERKLIHNADATLEVASVDAALARLRALTREAGGYTTSETRSRDYQHVNHGAIECRIPAGKLDSITAVLKSLGTVESLTLSTSDITEDYFDLEIRLRNQRALETRLLALLERPSNKLSDLLEAERELARVRGEIDQMEGRRRFWDNRVALSSLSVNVHEPVPTVGGEQGGAWSVLRDAFAESANNFVLAVAGIISTAGGLIPVLVVLLVVGWSLVRAWRWRRARRGSRLPAT